MKLISGTAHRALAERIAASLDHPLADVEVTAFPDGETSVKINENVRGADVFIIQPSCPPTNHNIMELLIMAYACKTSNCKNIIGKYRYLPYPPYLTRFLTSLLNLGKDQCWGYKVELAREVLSSCPFIQSF